MEQRANYVATGAFVLLLIAGIVAAALWLSGAQLKIPYIAYETHISGSVSGLDKGAPVRLNGIGVGRVDGFRQDPQNPGDVILLLHIRQDAIIRTDSVATLEMTGLTGGRYVEITGGTLASPRLTASAAAPYPTIGSRPSSLDALLSNTSQIMAHFDVVADRLASILDDRNRQAIGNTLTNVNNLTATLNQRSQDLDRLLTVGDTALQNLAKAGATLNVVLEHYQGKSPDVDRLIASANMTFVEAAKLARNMDDVVRTSRPGLKELSTTVPARLDSLLTMATRLTASLDRVSAELERDPSSILFGARQEGYRPK